MWSITLGSFSGAAQKLDTTQPAISQRIAQLEREVGVRLSVAQPQHGSADAERQSTNGLCGETDRAAFVDGNVGCRRRPLGHARRAAAWRRRELIVHTWLTQLIKGIIDTYPNLTLEIEVDITVQICKPAPCERDETGH